MRTPRLSDPTRMVVPMALCLILLNPGLTRSQQVPRRPPDDAPAESFPSSTPGPGPLDPAPPLLPGPLKPPNIGGGVWLAQGPGPAIGGQVEAITPGPGEVVGAVHALAAHPSDPDTLYAGGVNGGVWRTTNATTASPTWTPLTDAETSLSIGALEFDPTDVSNMTLVAGVGHYSSFASFGGVRTGKLLKTTDGGATWSTLAGSIGISPAGISGVAPRGMTIVASVNTSDAFSCGDIGIWRSTDGGASFSKLSVGAGVPAGVAFDLAGDTASGSTLYTGITFGPFCSGLANGIYRSTDTGGAWTKVSSAAMDALIIDFTTTNIEIAAAGVDVYVDIIQSGRPVGIFHSGDGGTSWTSMDIPRTPEGTPLPIPLIAPGAPIVISTSAAHGLSSGMEVEITGVTSTVGANGVWTTLVLSPTTFSLTGSTDVTAWVAAMPPETWVKVVGLNPRVKPGSQGAIHASIRVDPGTPTTVYLGGDRQDSPFPNFLGAGDFSGRLFRGDTTVSATGAIPSPQWEHLTHAIGPPTAGGGTVSGSAPHADSREMVFDANGNLIESDDGGIYRRTSPTSNAGDWFSIIGDMQVTEQHDVAYDAISDIIISGNQDTGTTQQQVSSGVRWDSVSTGDGGDVAVDDLTVPAISTRYSSFQNLGSFRRREYNAANVLQSSVAPSLTQLGGFPIINNFLTPVVLNAITPTRLLLGGCNAVFESFDKGDSVTDIPGLVSPGCASPVMTFPQNAIAYGGMSGGVPNADAVWVGSGIAVFKRLAPPPASLVVTPTAFPGATVTDIVLDPTDTSTAYVLDATGVYQTHDGGTTWTLMTGNLTDTRLGSAVIDPTPPARLFVGGREGVSVIALPAPGVQAVGPFVWGQIGTGLPNAPVWDMEWDATDGTLVVGTLGRGAWVLAAPTVSSIAPTSGTTAGGTEVTITGTNFATGATVSIGGVAATGVMVVNSTTITATTGAHAAGTVNVVVTNSDTLTGTLTNGFTYASLSGTPFTDDPLVPGTTAIKAVHFNQLRDRINEQLVRFLQPVQAYTNLITAGLTVRAVDLTEMYTAVNNALVAASQSAIAVPTITPGVTVAVVSHINNLRARVLTLEAL